MDKAEYCVVCADGYEKGDGIPDYQLSVFQCKQSGMPMAAVVGIVVGVIAATAIAGGVAAFFIIKAKKSKA